MVSLQGGSEKRISCLRFLFSGAFSQSRAHGMPTAKRTVTLLLGDARCRTVEVTALPGERRIHTDRGAVSFRQQQRQAVSWTVPNLRASVYSGRGAGVFADRKAMADFERDGAPTSSQLAARQAKVFAHACAAYHEAKEAAARHSEPSLLVKNAASSSGVDTLETRAIVPATIVTNSDATRRAVLTSPPSNEAQSRRRPASAPPASLHPRRLAGTIAGTRCLRPHEPLRRVQSEPRAREPSAWAAAPSALGSDQLSRSPQCTAPRLASRGPLATPPLRRRAPLAELLPTDNPRRRLPPGAQLPARQLPARHCTRPPRRRTGQRRRDARRRRQRMRRLRTRRPRRGHGHRARPPSAPPSRSCAPV